MPVRTMRILFRAPFVWTLGLPVLAYVAGTAVAVNRQFHGWAVALMATGLAVSCLLAVVNARKIQSLREKFGAEAVVDAWRNGAGLRTSLKGIVGNEREETLEVKLQRIRREATIPIVWLMVAAEMIWWTKQ